jgi:hypothetical protein
MPRVFQHENPEKVQEIIFYFSSRLRAATIATLDPANATKTWMIKYVIWELVRMLFFNMIIFQSTDIIFVVAVGFVIRRHGRGTWPPVGYPFDNAGPCKSFVYSS